MDAVEDNLLAAAQYFDLVRPALGRGEDRGADFVEWLIRSIQHGTLRCLAGADGGYSDHPFRHPLQFVGNRWIPNIDVNGCSSAGQNSCVRRFGVLICPAGDEDVGRLRCPATQG